MELKAAQDEQPLIADILDVEVSQQCLKVCLQIYQAQLDELNKQLAAL